MATPRYLQILSLGLGLSLTLAAQDPWAVTVMSYDPGTSSAMGYQTPDRALGRPTVDTYADSVELEPSVPVVPVYAPWDPSELVSIGEGGSLVLRMGKPITDNPAHPYGVDLLIFAYTFITGADAYDQVTKDPRLYTLASSEVIGLFTASKWGQISLSADGSTWHPFPFETDLVRLLPTLGRTWTGTEWGLPTDPTFPPDPDLILADLADMNLAELCRRYRGGAGGMGFDLADLLPPSVGSLPSSFSYIRIAVPDDGNSLINLRIEIDAVTVVSPVEAYTRWTQKEFAWIEDPAQEQPEANPESDPFTNWQEFARGGDPQVEETSLWLPQVKLGMEGLSYTLPNAAKDAPWLIQTSIMIEGAFSWLDMSPQPIPSDTPFGEDIDRQLSVPTPAESGPEFFRLRLEDAP